MANLFIGFPVPRAKIATMIEEAAPPLNHVDNHLPDGTDPIVDPGDISDDQILTWNGTKFVGSDAPTAGPTLSPISVPPSAFNPKTDEVDYNHDQMNLCSRVGLDLVHFFAPIYFPQGVTVTKLTMNSYREDDAAEIMLRLWQQGNVGEDEIMAEVTSVRTTGDGSDDDTSIDYALIDNASYSYCLDLRLNPNDSIGDVILWNAKIYFT